MMSPRPLARKSRLPLLMSASLLIALSPHLSDLIYPQDGAGCLYAQDLGEWEVIANVANVYAGPSQAYSVKGRVFAGEKVRVLSVSPQQDWLQLQTSSGAQGWVRADTLKNPRRQVQVEDPGRLRRQTEYQYDAQGRRLTTAGDPMGSGEGVGAQQPAPQQGFAQQPAPQQGFAQQPAPQQGFAQQVSQGQMMGQPMGASASAFKLAINTGALHAARRFSSDIRNLSPLAFTESKALLVSYGLELSYALSELIHLRLTGSDARGNNVALPAHPQFPAELPAVELATSQTSGALEALIGAQLGTTWLGLSLGANLLRHSFDEPNLADPRVKGFTPLQTHTYLSASVGLNAEAQLAPLVVQMSAQALIPLSVSAAPFELGAWQGLGYRGALRLSLPLSDSLDLGVYFVGQYMGVDVTSQGAYSDRFYIDPVEGGTGALYSKASTSDLGLQGGLSLGLSL